MIIPIKMGFSNAFVIKQRGTILVDSGAPGAARHIRQALRQNKIAETDLRLILHTHGHGDHAGNSAELNHTSGVPLAIHPADLDMLTTGRNRALKNPTRLEARLLAPFVNQPFNPGQADILIDKEISLDAYGIDGQVLFTPGHTIGSITVVLASGEAIVGDICMGGVLGGKFNPTQPTWHYFYEDPCAARTSLIKLEHANVRKLYVGHGGPLDFTKVKRLIDMSS